MTNLQQRMQPLALDIFNSHKKESQCVFALAFSTPLSAACPFPFRSVRIVECLRLCKEKMDAKNVYFTNPAFDSSPAPQPRTGMAKG